jgi:hypothetical protein
MKESKDVTLVHGLTGSDCNATLLIRAATEAMLNNLSPQIMSSNTIQASQLSLPVPLTFFVHQLLYLATSFALILYMSTLKKRLRELNLLVHLEFQKVLIR